MLEQVPDSRELREFLCAQTEAVAAPISGGCCRYIFSARVRVVISPDGRVELPDAAALQHELIEASSLDLRFVLQRSPDGMELDHLVLTGQLGPAGFSVRTARVEFASGRHVTVSLP